MTASRRYELSPDELRASLRQLSAMHESLVTRLELQRGHLATVLRERDHLVKLLELHNCAALRPGRSCGECAQCELQRLRRGEGSRVVWRTEPLSECAALSPEQTRCTKPPLHSDAHSDGAGVVWIGSVEECESAVRARHEGRFVRFPQIGDDDGDGYDDGDGL